jgi:hypothetical protein
MLRDVRRQVLDESEHILASGALDLDGASDIEGRGPFVVPKLVLTVALRRASDQWAPLPFDTAGRRALKDLESV